MTVKESAYAWGISARRVSKMCGEGKIPGAEKAGRSWVIPDNARKPKDHRINSGAYMKHQLKEKLPLPVGVSDYAEAVTNYYYVDKTMLIKDFIDALPKVSLFTRPRRFGKTLNMDMLKTFFEITEEDTSVYFKNKKIWECGEKYREYQGKYPVIFITFKDVKKETWDETYDMITKLISLEFRRHIELKKSNKLNEYEKTQYAELAKGSANNSEYQLSLQTLSALLHKHYGKETIIIIDEYDTPIQQGYSKGFYDQVILFMRNLFSGALKDNKSLSYGFLTGILRVSKESIFSGLNNLTINSVLDNKYSQYFGFTPEEVREMTLYYGVPDKYDEICKWYDGYRFGKSEIFNPWSVINYFANDCEPRAFWQSTGSNDIIGEIISHADKDIYDKLTSLVSGKSFTTYIDTSVIYPQIKSDPSAIYSFLLMAGYLKVIQSEPSFGGDFMCDVTLPNKEIAYVYHKEILRQLSNVIPQSTAVLLQEAIYNGDNNKLQELIETLLMQSASYFDVAGENFYHGLMLGLCSLFAGYYTTSNRESGEGRYDIQLMPIHDRLPGILIELKAEKNIPDDELSALSYSALKQINAKKYDSEMVTKGVKTIYKYGVAFSGKRVRVAVEL